VLWCSWIQWRVFFRLLNPPQKTLMMVVAGIPSWVPRLRDSCNDDFVGTKYNQSLTSGAWNPSKCSWWRRIRAKEKWIALPFSAATLCDYKRCCIITSSMAAKGSIALPAWWLKKLVKTTWLT
jgi:hypothetical protein